MREIVANGSSAAVAGVKSGDYLVSVGDIAVEDQQFGARLRAKYGASRRAHRCRSKFVAGRRRSRSREAAVRARRCRVEADPAAKAKAVKIRDGILKGIVDQVVRVVSGATRPDQGGKSVANAAQGPFVRVVSRISLVTVLSASAVLDGDGDAGDALGERRVWQAAPATQR